jgi:hypothetical protein
VSPALHHTDELPSDLSFTQQHGEHAVAEELLEIFKVESGSDPEHTESVKNAIRA